MTNIFIYVAIANFFCTPNCTSSNDAKAVFASYQLKKHSFPKALSCIFGTVTGVSWYKQHRVFQLDKNNLTKIQVISVKLLLF